MQKSDKSQQASRIERRKSWDDRRSGNERRNSARLRHMDGDCRNNVPRRESDLAGMLSEGEQWWSGDKKFL